MTVCVNRIAPVSTCGGLGSQTVDHWRNHSLSSPPLPYDRYVLIKSCMSIQRLRAAGSGHEEGGFGQEAISCDLLFFFTLGSATGRARILFLRHFQCRIHESACIVGCRGFFRFFSCRWRCTGNIRPTGACSKRVHPLWLYGCFDGGMVDATRSCFQTGDVAKIQFLEYESTCGRHVFLRIKRTTWNFFWEIR